MQNGATAMKGIWQYLLKLQASLSLDPTIPLVGISHTDPLACIQMTNVHATHLNSEILKRT